MKFQRVLMATGFCALAWSATAGPEIPREPLPKSPGKSLEELVQELGHEQYRTREEASRRIWAMGESALSLLQETVKGDDPEMSYRARDLIRKIQLHITPDTDPAVLLLVERYSGASVEEKVSLFDEMHKKRAWRQILKLFAAEKNAELQSRLQASVTAVAVVAAREQLRDGNVEGAREFLELAPADAAGLLALADFHRSQGSLGDELKRARGLEGPRSKVWQLALHRAAGNLKEARALANAADEPQLGAAMALLLGDPLPWLRREQAGQRKPGIYKTYTELAIKRWQGKAIRPAELASVVRAAQSENHSDRSGGLGALFLLGETKLAEAAYVKASPLAGFVYFEPMERIQEAFSALGLDPDKPDYAGWVAKRLKNLLNEEVDDDVEGAGEMVELVVMANFVERRGLSEILEQAFSEPILALAEKDEGIFTDLLSALFGNLESMTGAPQLARNLATRWAGEDQQRWLSVMEAAFGGQDDVMSAWEFLGELDPERSRIERMDGLLAVLGIVPDPLLVRDKWLGLAWTAYEAAPEEEKLKILGKITLLTSRSSDVATSMKILDLLPAQDRRELLLRSRIMELSAAERWDDAASVFLKQIEQINRVKRDPQPSLHAIVAACLRRAGRPEEALIHDEWVDQLSLGHDAVEIANGYSFGYDYSRAAEWYARAARMMDPESPHFADTLKLHLDMLLEQGKWAEVASVAEVAAQLTASGGSDTTSGMIKVRLQADLGRAMAMLANDRAGALAILEDCYQRSPGDGFMADHFFPSIREMGLIKEHDKWFNLSWNSISSVLRQFPGSDNTYNSAGWLASRACRNLDQAEGYLKKALALNPRQAAYLDTMAEIHFAKRDRKTARRWSTEAMNYRPDDPMLRRQHERFRSAPFPR
jgi:tetratricopeptide (TPR) repeat protein